MIYLVFITSFFVTCYAAMKYDTGGHFGWSILGLTTAGICWTSFGMIIG